MAEKLGIHLGSSVPILEYYVQVRSAEVSFCMAVVQAGKRSRYWGIWQRTVRRFRKPHWGVVRSEENAPMDVPYWLSIPSDTFASRRNKEENHKKEVQSLRMQLETTQTELATTQTEVGGLRGQLNMLFSMLQSQGFNLGNGLHCPLTNSHGSSCS